MAAIWNFRQPMFSLWILTNKMDTNDVHEGTEAVY